MNAHTAQWFILVLVNIPVFLGLGRLIFGGWEDFLDVVSQWTQATWYRNLEQQWREEPWFTAKLPCFVLLCTGLVVLEYLMFGKSSLKPATQVIGLL